MTTPAPLELIVLEETLRYVETIDQSPCNGCDMCGARCTAGVPILHVEFAAIRAFLVTPEGEEARRLEQEDKQTPYPGTEPDEGVFYTACRFRDRERGRCSIYPVRPLVCRLFGHVEWLPCPIQKVPGPTPGGFDAMKRYGEGGLRTYEEWLAGEE
jgi:Fe-S-cluster containining protein